MLLGLSDFEILFPATVDEACRMLAEHGEVAKLFAGGTDLLIVMKLKRKLPKILINIKRIPGLADITQGEDGILSIGALAISTDIGASPLVRNTSHALTQAAEVLGTSQIRNLGTIGGNLGNASPSAEFAPPLLCLNAVVRCMGPNGARDIPVDEFFLNPGITALGQSEMITEIRVPPPAANKADVYIKHSLRRMDVAMASAAVYVELDGGQIVDARIALGAVAPTPFRAVKSEEILRGNQVSDELIIEAAKMATSEATPIDDIRSYADYRKDTVREMVARGLSQVISERQERVHA